MEKTPVTKGVHCGKGLRMVKTEGGGICGKGLRIGLNEGLTPLLKIRECTHYIHTFSKLAETKDMILSGTKTAE